jgi:hypothetical protein
VWLQGERVLSMTQKDLQKFIELVKKEIGKNLEEKEASLELQKLLSLVKIVRKSNTENYNEQKSKIYTSSI